MTAIRRQVTDDLAALRAADYRDGQLCTARLAEGLLCLERATSGWWPWPLCERHGRQLDQRVEGRVRAAASAARSAVVEERALLRRRRQTREVVYFVERPNGDVKIGFTARLSARIPAIAAYEGDVRLIGLRRGGRRMERYLHEKLAEDRIGRSEWFRPSAAVIAAAKSATYEPRGHGERWRRFA